MSFKLAFVIFSSYLIPYIIDYAFDMYNGINFIMEPDLALACICGPAYGMSKLNDSLDGGVGVSCYSPVNVEANRRKWGVFSIIITAMPGVAFAFIRIFQFLSTNSESKSKSALRLLFECILIVIFYPLYVVFVHLRSSYRVLTGGDADLSMLLNFGALEVVLESGPQLVLQFHTIATGVCPTVIQIFTLLTSFLIIGKVAVEFHIGGDVFNMGFMEKNVKLLKLLPLFVSCIVFRVGTLTILTTHINWWIILPCMVSCVVVTVMASNNNYALLSAIIAGPVNLFVMGTGMDLEHGFEKGRVGRLTTRRSSEEKNNQNKFYKQSTLFILIWNILLLSGFLVAWNYFTDCKNTDLLDHFFMKDWRQKVFLMDEIKDFGLYIVTGVTMLAGLLNALFLFVDTREELDDSLKSTRRKTTEMAQLEQGSFSDDNSGNAVPEDADYVDIYTAERDNDYDNAEELNRWDHGKMTRADCEDQVLGDIVGGFIVRESKGRKVLSVKTDMATVTHFNIHQDEEGKWSLDKEMYFSLVELVEFYRENEIPKTDIKLK
eukprot:GFUD01012676.1.p1 GENE.GFUD01012676.1~~GFUD01012676.1.p1  ORF type:complete len:547 (-),score=79.15 GFUD01012676.1:142-1782(-)